MFFIAIGVLVAVSSVYLLHEYWSGALGPEEPALPQASAEAEPANESLKAA